MRFRYSSLGKRHVQRFFKRLPMDTGLDWNFASPLVWKAVDEDNPAK
ncbi:Hypothetical protein LUCI_3213 [Lucifera butyrica]|uniref:Uncharacterized protein n=1 Tax=Lucifera butyrica TaxID=1351585 RepID=A0A498RFS0_9FIRM|nr:hypothetical protein [Lucifera butyrica]VBB07948.1 Hypothetical protein LUCI_3213 [Lucifera butyrica]